jgi:hypothetical protein
VTAIDSNEHDDTPPATERERTALLHGDIDRVEGPGLIGPSQWLGPLIAKKERENGGAIAHVDIRRGVPRPRDRGVDLRGVGAQPCDPA